MIRVARRFGRFRRGRRALRQADLAIFEPEPASRPANGLADAEAVYDRNEVERVALLAGAEIAPYAGFASVGFAESA